MSVNPQDTVEVNYVGRLESGEVFDSSEGRNPLKFVVGSGQVIPGFDDALVGMKLNETKTVHIPCAQAYGDVRSELIMVISRQQLPADIDPKVGMQLISQTPDGSQIPVTITKVDNDQITIDANHALAGKDLIFDITLVSIN